MRMSQVTANLRLWPSKAPALFLNRESEWLRWRNAIAAGESLLVTGPEGIGKTALARHVIKGLNDCSQRRVLYVSGARGLRRLLEGILALIFERGDATLVKDVKVRNSARSSFTSWLEKQPTSTLKGCLYRSLSKGDYLIFLDHSTPITVEAAKILDECTLACGTPLYLLVREEGEAGEARNIFRSERSRMTIPRLPRWAAAELIEWCIQTFCLRKLDLTHFRDDVLRMSGSAPGAITAICALAAQPRYQSSSKIKTRLAFIDYVSRGTRPEPKRNED